MFFQKSFPRPRETCALGAWPQRRTSSLRGKALSSAIGADQAPPPGKALSPWRLALAVVAGAISGVVPFNGPVLVFKGGTYKEKVSRSEFTGDEDGNVLESRILNDRFAPGIRVWNRTPGSAGSSCRPGGRSAAARDS